VLDLKGWVMKSPDLTDAERWYVLESFLNPVDSMCAAALITLMVMKGDSLNREIETPVMPPELYFKSVSSSAMDMHTADGKRALMAFHTSLAKRYPVIEQIPKDSAVKALGAVVFVLEGGLVDRRVKSPELDKLKLLQDQQLMKGYGLPEVIRDEVVGIVGQEFERLNQKRHWVTSL